MVINRPRGLSPPTDNTSHLIRTKQNTTIHLPGATERCNNIIMHHNIITHTLSHLPTPLSQPWLARGGPGTHCPWCLKRAARRGCSRPSPPGSAACVAALAGALVDSAAAPPPRQSRGTDARCYSLNRHRTPPGLGNRAATAEGRAQDAARGVSRSAMGSWCV